MSSASTTLIKIGYKICQMRGEKKMSQKQLAQKLKTTQSAVARMETGHQNFTFKMLQKIAAVFDRNLKIDFVKSLCKR